MTLLLIGCSDHKRNLIGVEKDSDIDLTQLDSVRKALNGYWINENNMDEEMILWLDFYKDENLTTWQLLPYQEDVQNIEELGIPSCSTIATLIKLNGKVQLEFVSLGGSDTLEIKSLSMTKFKVDGTTYLKHKGYDFMRSINIPEFAPEK